ncbi:MAG: universal stress protein [Meiothermus sp.]|nr:universal stress protein [Meiothermus sp.]
MRVLLMTDFSEGSSKALEFVRKHFPDAQTRLLHVVDVAGLGQVSKARSKTAHTALEMQQSLADEAERRLAELGGGEVLYGQPAEVGLKEARDWGTDLIVVGTANKRGLEHLFMGSVAERVARESPVPVLVVGNDDRV